MNTQRKIKRLVRSRKKREIPSTPKRRAKEKEGSTAIWNVSWKPPFLVDLSPQRRSVSRKLIEVLYRATVYVIDAFLEYRKEFAPCEPPRRNSTKRLIRGSLNIKRSRSLLLKKDEKKVEEKKREFINKEICLLLNFRPKAD